jgi:hypothetical protein
MLFLIRTAMNDLNNVLVLTAFAGSLVAVIVGYLFAWRSKRIAYRTAGSFITAAVAGFAGLLILMWLIVPSCRSRLPMEARFGSL